MELEVGHNRTPGGAIAQLGKALSGGLAGPRGRPAVWERTGPAGVNNYRRHFLVGSTNLGFYTQLGKLNKIVDVFLF